MPIIDTLPNDLPVPGPRWGAYPERRDAGSARPSCRSTGALRDVAPNVRRARELAQSWVELDDESFDRQRMAVQGRLASEGFVTATLEPALAVAIEACRRSLGRRPYDGQLLAAWHMLHQRLVEMATGEGKSLATALAACVAGLSGMPVHVLTANDYLVQRDAQAFAPMYRRAGLDVAAVVAGLPDDQRRRAYAHPVVFVTAKELVFDYLRDRQRRPAGSDLMQRAVSMGRSDTEAPVLRGLCMALIDEADSVLIDEAQMPLILSREVDNTSERAFLWQAWRLSEQLVEGVHFELEPARRLARLTAQGEAHVTDLTEPLATPWRSARHRAHAFVTALAARHLYLRDRDYVVSDHADGRGGRIVIVDQVTGRAAEGRRWARGLHGLVALKEACPPEPDMETLAQMTYQRFFGHFHRLGGLSGTLSEVRHELRGFYGLSVVEVPSRQPCRRQTLPMRVFTSHAARWDAVAARCAELRAQRRPVLIATDSVADSRALSAVLQAAGLDHTVLDARQDADEAEVVAKAGKAGQITVATQMAGRGTDIAPDAVALWSGGLHVLCCQANASRRLDRQLVGRAARQGQPGSSETWVSLASARFSAGVEGRIVAFVLRAGAPGRELSGWSRACIAGLQRLDEWRLARMRRSSFRHDCRVEQGLAFAAGV